jgi:integrase
VVRPARRRSRPDPAERHRLAWQVELNGLGAEADGMPWDAFVSRYLESSAPDLERASHNLARWVLERFGRLVHPRSLEAVDYAAVDRFRLGRRAVVSQTTVAKELRTLHAAFSWAVDARLIRENPVGRLRRHGRAQRPDVDAMSDAEITRFLGQLAGRPPVDPGEPVWAQAALRLACLWGPRTGELARIVREDLDLSRRVLRIPVTGRRTTKEGRGKSVPLDEETAGLLQELSHRDGPILWGPPDAPFPSWRVFRDKLVERARAVLEAIGVHPRDEHCMMFLRRTAETRMRRRGVPDWMFGAILGHRTAVGEQYYLGMGPEEIARQAGDLARVAPPGVTRGSPAVAGDGPPGGQDPR